MNEKYIYNIKKVIILKLSRHFAFLIIPLLFLTYEFYDDLININNLRLLQFIYICLFIFYTYSYLLFTELIYFFSFIQIKDNEIVLEGFKFFKPYKKVINFQHCDYYITSVYFYRGSNLKYLRFKERESKENILIDFDGNTSVVDELYNYLMVNYPTNNKGKRWKFLIIGNNWYYILKPYILKIFERK